MSYWIPDSSQINTGSPNHLCCLLMMEKGSRIEFWYALGALFCSLYLWSNCFSHYPKFVPINNPQNPESTVLLSWPALYLPKTTNTGSLQDHLITASCTTPLLLNSLLGKLWDHNDIMSDAVNCIIYNITQTGTQ